MFARDFSELSELKKRVLVEENDHYWRGLLNRVDLAHETAMAQTNWSQAQKFGLVCATLIHSSQLLIQSLEDSPNPLSPTPPQASLEPFFPANSPRDASGKLVENEPFLQALLGSYQRLVTAGDN